MQIEYPNYLGQGVVLSGITPSFIISARVLDVNLANYTLTVAPQFFRNPVADVPFMSPYQHFDNGEGIYFMPEVGSVCWLCFSSEGGKPFVLGFMGVPENDNARSFKNNKQDLNPGDIYLGTRDENFLWLRRGGVVQIGGGPLSQRIYIPVGNIIRDFCENYELHTIGGDLTWNVLRSEETTDGNRPAIFRIAAREHADDAAPIAELQIGSHDADDETILSLLIKSDGQEDATKKIELRLKKDGDVGWTVKGSVSWEIDGQHNLHAKDNVNLSSDKDFTVSALQQAILMGATVGITASSGAITLAAGAAGVNAGPTMNVGGGKVPVAMSADTIVWLATHVHPLDIPHGLTLPSTTPILPGITSKSLFAK